MKVFTLLSALAATALAQNVFINLPKGKSLKSGSEVIVQVQRPNSLTGSTEMAVAVGLQQCATSPCHDAASVFGTILYNGPFAPAYHEGPYPPYENFTVNVPDNAEKGRAIIAVAHASFVGAGNWPLFEVVNQTVTIV